MARLGSGERFCLFDSLSIITSDRTASVTTIMSQDIILSDGLASSPPTVYECLTTVLHKIDDNNVVLLRHSFITHYQSAILMKQLKLPGMESLNYTMPLRKNQRLSLSQKTGTLWLLYQIFYLNLIHH